MHSKRARENACSTLNGDSMALNTGEILDDFEMGRKGYCRFPFSHRLTGKILDSLEYQ